jgi:hypothetical protein
MKFNAVVILIGALAIGAYAQRPRTMDPAQGSTAKSTPTPPPAPQTFKAKYEGGVVGYTTKQDGTLSFDDANHRLVFRNKQQKDVLFVPYEAVMSAYPDTQSRRPTAATVASAIPAPYGLNMLGWLVRKKYRYLTLNFDDPDTRVSGLTSFKVENKEILASVLNTLASKAGLTQRGEGFIRKKTTAQATAPGP